MYLKTKNGITMVALMITVIIMLILIGVSINYGNNAIKTAKLEDIKTNMLSIKAKAKIVLEEHNFEKSNLVGSQISNDEAAVIGATNSNKLLKWSKEDLDNQGLNSIEGNQYIVDYNDNCEVYYLKGYDGAYSLTDLQDK